MSQDLEISKLATVILEKLEGETIDPLVKVAALKSASDIVNNAIVAKASLAAISQVLNPHKR